MAIRPHSDCHPVNNSTSNPTNAVINILRREIGGKCCVWIIFQVLNSVVLCRWFCWSVFGKRGGTEGLNFNDRIVKIVETFMICQLNDQLKSYRKWQVIFC